METNITFITELYTESLTESDGPAPTYIDMIKSNKYGCVIMDNNRVKGMLDLKEAMNCIVKLKAPQKNGNNNNALFAHGGMAI